MRAVMSMSNYRGRLLCEVMGGACLTLLTASLACAPLPEAPKLGADNPSQCESISGESTGCAGPFPSMEWLNPDSATPTGFAVSVPSGIMSALTRSELGPGATPEELVDGADGFSPVTPVIFTLPESIDPGSVPTNGGDEVVALDLTTGKRVAIRVELAGQPEERASAENVLLVWPRARFEPGHRILVTVTSGIAPSSVPQLAVPESSIVASVGWMDRDGRRQSPSELLEGTLLEGRSVVDATSFVVRSETNMLGNADEKIAQVRTTPHAVRGLQTIPSLVADSVTVTGQVSVLDFRDERGLISLMPGATSTPSWRDFFLTVPNVAASPNGAPVMLYGHGLAVGTKETTLLVAAQNAAHGMATIGIDMPHHGALIAYERWLIDLARPSTAGQLVDSLLQGELENVAVVQAIQTSLASLDVAPHRWWQPGGDGIPDLDPEHLLFTGVSFGSLYGGAIFGMEPDLDAAFVQVGGAGIIDTIYHSFLWPLFSGTVPVNATSSEAFALLGLVQLRADRADPASYLLRAKQRGQALFLAYGVGEGTVENSSSERVIEMMKLPLVGPQLGPVTPGLEVDLVDRMPASGNGAQQLPTNQIPASPVRPIATHMVFLDQVGEATLNEWLDGRQREARQ